MWIVCFLLLLNTTVLAQTAVEYTGVLYLSGKVVDENKRGLPSYIYVYKNREVTQKLETSKLGKFEIPVPLQDSVAFVVYSNGYVSKTVLVNTLVPGKKEKEDYIFPFFIDLYPVGKTPSHIDLDRPVGKILFSGTQFVYDINFTKASNEMLKEFVRERKDLNIRPLKE